MIMKKKLRVSIIIILGVFLFLAGGIVQSQAAPYSLIMDEYGPGYYKDLGSSNPEWITWNGQLLSDPTWAGQTSLIYIGAPAPGWAGYVDILVKDPNGAISDILRIWNSSINPTYTWCILYSSDTSGGAPADTGLPPATSWNVYDTVSEGSDGIFYWTSPQFGTEFKVYSEGRASVPEPTTMLLLGLGLMGLAGVRRKFKK